MADAAYRALRAARRAWGNDWSPTRATRAPGRLELLGNHVDYNGGKVLAAAIDRDVVCLVGPSPSGEIESVFADADDGPVVVAADELTEWRSSGGKPQPADYLRGAIATAIARGAEPAHGMRIAIAGDLPIGFGLSSSAALCVALTLGLHEPTPAGRDLVLRAQEAEHRAGTPCGTMDQSASVGGEVILFDSATVSWQPIAPDLGRYVFAVADSGVSRSLGVSSYPKRVEESIAALAIVNRELKRAYESLSELNEADTAAAMALDDGVLSPTLKRRIRHIVTERERVAVGVEAMRAADWPRFGQLMTESGASSANDYEISHPRVEEMVAIARGLPGVAGARMMGGGEGGTALVLLESTAVPALRAALDDAYYRRYEMTAERSVRVFQFADGAGELPLSR